MEQRQRVGRRRKEERTTKRARHGGSVGDHLDEMKEAQSGKQLKCGITGLNRAKLF